MSVSDDSRVRWLLLRRPTNVRGQVDLLGVHYDRVIGRDSLLTHARLEGALTVRRYLETPHAILLQTREQPDVRYELRYHKVKYDQAR